jgi:hypothetical protein
MGFLELLSGGGSNTLLGQMSQGTGAEALLGGAKKLAPKQGAEALLGGAKDLVPDQTGKGDFLSRLGKKGPHNTESFLGRVGNVAHKLDNNNGWRGLTGQQPNIDPRLIEALTKIYGGSNGTL